MCFPALALRRGGVWRGQEMTEASTSTLCQASAESWGGGHLHPPLPPPKQSPLGSVLPLEAFLGPWEPPPALFPSPAGARTGLALPGLPAQVILRGLVTRPEVSEFEFQHLPSHPMGHAL